jgi:hypothetical protein
MRVYNPQLYVCGVENSIMNCEIVHLVQHRRKQGANSLPEIKKAAKLFP